VLPEIARCANCRDQGASVRYHPTPAGEDGILQVDLLALLGMKPRAAIAYFANPIDEAVV